MIAIARMEMTDRMSKIVIHQDTVYLCGQVADNSDAPIGPQTENMLAKVEQLLQQAGSGKENMLSATIYLRDMKDFAGMNAVWDQWVPQANKMGFIIRVPEFTKWFFEFSAKCMNVVHGRWENFWSSEQPSQVELKGPEDIVDKMLYVMCNPVAAALHIT